MKSIPCPRTDAAQCETEVDHFGASSVSGVCYCVTQWWFASDYIVMDVNKLHVMCSYGL